MPGGTQIIYDIQSVNGAQTTYITADHLGSGNVFLTSSGAVSIKESYSAYGYRRSSNWSGPLSATSSDYTTIASTTRRGYTDAFHEMLDNLNLIHMNGRVYDPVIGRFMSPDPVITKIGDSQRSNPYSYVENRPLTMTDPTGLQIACDSDYCNDNPTPLANGCASGCQGAAAGGWGSVGAGADSTDEFDEVTNTATGWSPSVIFATGDQNWGRLHPAPSPGCLIGCSKTSGDAAASQAGAPSVNLTPPPMSVPDPDNPGSYQDEVPVCAHCNVPIETGPLANVSLPQVGPVGSAVLWYFSLFNCVPNCTSSQEWAGMLKLNPLLTVAPGEALGAAGTLLPQASRAPLVALLMQGAPDGMANLAEAQGVQGAQTVVTMAQQEGAWEIFLERLGEAEAALAEAGAAGW